MAEPVRLTIDDQEIAVPAGATIREAALALGTHTPTLCYHPHLHCGSNCRACVVELEGSRTLVPACSRPAATGMNIQTDSARVRHSRRLVFELLMTEVQTSDAPELLAYARYYGADPSRYPGAGPGSSAGADPDRYPGSDPGPHAATCLPPSHTYQRPVLIDNPFFVRDYAKCIGCQRCVRACGEDVQHTFAIQMIGRGHLVSVGAGDPADDLTASPCVFCGNCVGVCPTGALMGLAEYDARQNGLLEPAQLRWAPAVGFTGPVGGPADGTGRAEVNRPWPSPQS